METGSISGNQLATTTSAQQNILGKDDFLRLMLMQMQHQDPLNPMDNQAMLSQMAQFSSLEQMSNLNSSFENAAASQSLMQATSLLGKKVQVLDPNSTPDQPGTLTSKVVSVRHSESGPVLTLENGLSGPISQVLQVEESVE